MPIPEFIDVHPAFAAGGYSVTNEEPTLFRDLLGTRSFKRAASIASGGEIPLFVLLPRSEEVVAIDHSYRAIAACYLKILLLDAIGPKATKKLFVEGTREKFKKIVKGLVDDVPAALQTYVNLDEGYKEHPTTRASISPTLSSYDWGEIRKEWYFIPDDLIKAASQRLDRIKFIHGDLKDLAQHGKFDALYVSNATGHSGRDEKSPTFSDWLPFLNTGALVLSTGGSTYAAASKEWKQIKKVHGYRTSWEHQVYQLLKVRKRKVKAVPEGPSA